MSMDHTPPRKGDETPLFATPVWERGRKRGFARPSRPQARTPAAAVSGVDVAEAYGVGGPPPTEPVRTTRVHRRAHGSRGLAAATIALGLGALAAVGAGVWYLGSQDDGIVELAPGEPPIMAQAPPAADTLAPTLAQPSVAPPALEPRAPVATRSASVQQTGPRARPAARSAADSGLDASASAPALPGGPMPYSQLKPQDAPSPTPVIEPQAAPVLPATPPISSDPAPAAGQPESSVSPIP